MTISYIYTGEPMTGTANDDFFIAYKGSTGTDNNTVNANGGDDLVIGDSSDTWIPAASYLNGSIGTAFNLETLTSTWTTAENEMFGNWTIPHTTVMCETTIGQSEFFRVAVGAGQQIIIDLDFASNTAIGNPRDLVVELQDSLGNVIASDDDSLVTHGGRGSFASAPGSASSYDPFLTFTVPTGGIYYINVRPFGSGPGSTFTDNNTFVMNVSVGGHAVAAANPVQGADTINGGEGDDALFGQGGGDVINGDGGDDFIDSGSGGDIVHGGEGNDTIYGGDGTEENIHGDNGDDRLFSGGEGHYYGDAGDDIIYAGLTGGVNEILDGGADIDTIDTTTWNGIYVVNLVTGVTNFGESFINFENVVTGNGADTITGTDAANVITTQAGIDTVNAGAGDDIVAGGADGDMLDGGADFDVLDYRTSTGAVTINLATNSASGGHAAGDVIANFEGVWGSVLGDTLTGNKGANQLNGGAGADTMAGGGGNDVLDGGEGDDTLDGGAGVADTATYDDAANGVTVSLLLQGAVQDTKGAGMDLLTGIERLTGSDFNDTLTGSGGANRLDGGAGKDIIRGRGGDDTIEGGAGNDTLDGQGGVDTASYGDAVKGVTVSLALQGSAQDTIGAGHDTLAGFEALAGSAFDDRLTGDGNDNRLSGGAGNDRLSGGAGNDTLIGGNGNDIMSGGTGKDTLTGGAGADQFKFQKNTTGATVNTADTITDFKHAEHDKINLNAIDAITGTPANDAFHFIGSAHFSGAAGELRIGSSQGDTMIQADTDGDKTADLMIRLTGSVSLSAGDFVGVTAALPFAADHPPLFHMAADFPPAPMECLA